MSKNKFYLTTPIYYANAAPHVGHTYATVSGDALVRAHRLFGKEAFLLVGTDEHGAKIQEMAEKSGKTPQEFVDDVAREFQEPWKLLNISNGSFLRTTDTSHMKAVEKALQYLYEKGDIYKGSYEGLYCVGCEQFKGENDLVNGLCPDHQRAPVIMQEESYMFKLSKYQDVLLKKIQNDELTIHPATRKNEVVSFYEKEGLKDISFSRKNVAWGIPVPWDPSHTVYVWADAFLSYLTGIGWEGTAGSAPEFWPADVHLLAKDILRVHATIWPAMLLALDLPLPKTILVHGYFLVDGQKMSKSLGNVITPYQLIDRYGSDAARYLLLTAAPFGNDGDINWKRLDERYTADMANGLGNLVQRVATLIENNLDKELIFDASRAGGIQELKSVLDDEVFKKAINEFKLHEALEEVWKKIDIANLYVNDHKPWALVKEDADKFLTVMTALVGMINHIAWLLQPFMPETAQKVFATFGLVGEATIADHATCIIAKGGPLFPRLS
jgi:methionyl-tRNA synthetase